MVEDKTMRTIEEELQILDAMPNCTESKLVSENNKCRDQSRAETESSTSLNIASDCETCEDQTV